MLCVFMSKLIWVNLGSFTALLYKWVNVTVMERDV